MKNTLWRFGDSWSTTKDYIYSHIELNHSDYIAEYFNMNLNHLGDGGYSNLDIFKIILENSNKYKSNDIILINFASISRVGIVDKLGVVNTSNGGDTIFKNKTMMNIISNDMGTPISDILFYLIDTYLKSLIENGIRVYYFFNDNTRGDFSLTLNSELIFENDMNGSFIGWCIENGHQDLTPTGNVHFTLGSQKSIANKIIELIEQYDNKEK